MVMRRDIGNAEADRHQIEEGRMRQRRAAGPEILAGVEDQLVGADVKIFAGKDRATIDPAVRIGLNRFQMSANLAVELEKIDPEPLGRRAEGGVENMCRQSGPGAGSLMTEGVSKKNSSRLFPGPSRSTTRKSEVWPSAISG